MKNKSKHGKKYWMNQYGVAIPRELCGNLSERRRKPSGQVRTK